MEWNNITETPPPVNKRIIVSDGEIITIAQCVVDNTHTIWIFDESKFKELEVKWWMPLPKLPLNYNEEIHQL
jgi:hypothetical protein